MRWVAAILTNSDRHWLVRARLLLRLLCPSCVCEPGDTTDGKTVFSVPKILERVDRGAAAPFAAGAFAVEVFTGVVFAVVAFATGAFAASAVAGVLLLVSSTRCSSGTSSSTLLLNSCMHQPIEKA